MKLTPVQILACLGFTVPAEGIEGSPTTLAFLQRTLQGLGSTMDLNAVDVKELQYMHGLQAGTGVWHGAWAATGSARPAPDEGNLQAIRVAMEQTLQATFGYTNSTAQLNYSGFTGEGISSECSNESAIQAN